VISLHSFARLLGRPGTAMKLAIATTGVIAGLVAHAGTASATAAFARQTGMSCTACHTVRAPSMTATGKQFFIQGFRTPQLNAVVEHGPEGALGSGKEGAHLKLADTAGQYFWLRTRLRPYQQNFGDAFTGQEKQSFSELPQRFAFGFAGPIGDYVSIWNEEYIQPYTESFDVNCEPVENLGDTPQCEAGDHSWEETGGNQPTSFCTMMSSSSSSMCEKRQ
jgi:hypothetical protein